MGKTVSDGIKIHGFCRVQLKNSETKELVGDSGWQGPNQITNDGFLNFLVKLLGASAGSSQVGFMAIGTGTAPASSSQTLPGEIMSSTKRKAVTFTNVNSTTAQFTASWSSSDISAAYTIQNAGLFAATTTNATLFAGQTYATSQWNTNQDLNATYQIRFS
jgi:hypothetical protein